MAASNQAAHAAAINQAGAALLSAINAAKDDGLRVNLALRIVAEPYGPNVSAASVGYYQLSEVWAALNSPTS